VSSDIEDAVSYLCKTIPTNLKIDDEFRKAVDEMIDAIVNAEKIFLYGVGRSGLVAKAFAIRLVQLGLEVFFLGECNTPMVEPNSVAIVISNTGQTSSVVQTANIVRRIGGKVIAITSVPHSKLAHAASTNIIIANKAAGDEFRLEYAPLGTVFEEATALLLDGIVSVIMKKIGETDQSMRMRHAIWV